MTRIAAGLAIPCLLILLSGCATKPPTLTCDVATVYVDRYVVVDPRLLDAVEIVDLPEGEVDTIDLGVAYKAQRVRAQQCNGKLQEIGRWGESD